MRYVSEVATIENLDLQGTRVTNEGLSVLERLPGLKHLRLKENPQLSNECIPHLLRLKRLVDLQIHETSIDQDGVNQLAVMGALEDLCLDVWRGNYSLEKLLDLSARMPRCTILAKGRGEFFRVNSGGRGTNENDTQVGVVGFGEIVDLGVVLHAGRCRARGGSKAQVLQLGEADLVSGGGGDVAPTKVTEVDPADRGCRWRPAAGRRGCFDRARASAPASGPGR